MKPIASLHHVALTVSNLERSADWYSQVLGMVELFREESATRRAVVYRFESGGMSVGLVEHVGSTTNGFDPTVNGLDHVAFTVATRKDMRDWMARLDAHGVSHSDLIEVPPGEILNFKDPDAIALALFWDKGA